MKIGIVSEQPDDGWACVVCDGEIHVLPVGEHHTTQHCACQPLTDLTDSGHLMYVHAAFDGRSSGDVHQVAVGTQ